MTEGPAFSALQGAWRLDAIDGEPALRDPDASVEFHDDGRVAGSTGLNRFAGDWTVADGTLALGPLGSTLMAGPPERMEQERRILEILDAPLVVTLEGTALVLEGAGRLELTRIASPPDETLTRKVVTGTVTYRERIAPHPGSILTVRIVDVTLADVPAPVIAEDSYELTAVPAAFELFVDPEAIDDQRSYAIRADIHDAHGLLWTTETVYPIFAPDADETPELILVSVPPNP